MFEYLDQLRKDRTLYFDPIHGEQNWLNAIFRDQRLDIGLPNNANIYVKVLENSRNRVTILFII